MNSKRFRILIGVVGGGLGVVSIWNIDLAAGLLGGYLLGLVIRYWYGSIKEKEEKEENHLKPQVYTTNDLDEGMSFRVTGKPNQNAPSLNLIRVNTKNGQNLIFFEGKLKDGKHLEEGKAYVHYGDALFPFSGDIN